MSRTVASVVAVVALAMGLAPHAAQADPRHEEVTISTFAFQPAIVTVDGGQPVRWTNAEPLDIPHNVVIVSETGQPIQVLCPEMAPGQSCTVATTNASPRAPANVAGKPLAPGTYQYTCTVNLAHQALMHGVLVVG